MWRLEAAELLSSSSSTEDGGSQVLGVLQDSVVSLSSSGLVTVSQPHSGIQTTGAPLQSSAGSCTPVKSVTLPKRGKVFVASEEGFLHQVCHLPDQIQSIH